MRSKSGYGSERPKYCRSQDLEEGAKGLRGFFIHMTDETNKQTNKKGIRGLRVRI